MRVFVAGGTGVLGSRLLPLLVAGGHQVVGLARSPERAARVQRAGATAVIGDALDRDAVMKAVARAEPQVVVHELTAFAKLGRNLRRFERDVADTNLLRTEGTDVLRDAALAAGARRFVAQSFAGWTYARDGGSVKTEADPLDPCPPPPMRGAMDALRHHEDSVLGADGVDGIVLRYGTWYGPGTSFALDGLYVREIRRRRFPVIGDAGGVWSFVHIDDVARATIAAIERGEHGVYNIVDDEPAPVATWLPELAAAIGARSPWRVPVWLGRLFAGELAVFVMTEIRGSSNAKAKRELGWRPGYASWRDGFRHGLGERKRRRTVAPSPGSA
jgi:2-alkyl-3-oxoalkanoate reductase